MHTVIIRNKISVPRTRDRFIRRTDIYKKLDKAIGCKVIVVSAPAGFGKSSALSSWINLNNKTRCNTAWISLDDSDNDPITFWRYILYSVNDVITGIADELKNMLNSFEAKNISLQSMLSVLLSNIEGFKRDIYLVLDDFHIIESAEIYSELKFLIRNMPDNLHIIISGRNVPEIGISRLRAADALLEIGQEELCFSTEEIMDFFKVVMEIDISEGALQILKERTEGWAAGLQMAALSLKGSKSEKEVIQGFRGDHKYILDYLAEEVFMSLDSKLQEFLTATSPHKAVCSDLCNELLDTENSQSILEKLDSLNLFIIPLDENRIWYRYHNLFRDFLMNRYKRKDNGYQTQLCLKAGSWYEKNDMITLAVEFYLKGKSYDKAKNLIEGNKMGNMFSGDMRTVYEWCRQIPFEILLDSPRLCINIAWHTCITGDIQNTKQYIKHAENVLSSMENNGIKEGYISEIMVLNAIIASGVKIDENIMQYLEKAEEYVNNNLTLKTIMLLVKGSALIYKGKIDEARSCFRDSLRLGRDINNYYMVVMANRSLMISEMIKGSLKAGEERCCELLSYFEERHASEMPVVGMLYNDLADIYYIWNNLERSGEYAEKARGLGEKGDLIWVLSSSYTILAKIYAAYGMTVESVEFMSKAESIVQKDEIFDMQANIENEKVRLMISMGEFKLAEDWLKIRKYDALKDYKPMFINQYITTSRYFIGTSQLERAEKLTDKLCSGLEKWGSMKACAEVLILQAIICKRKGQVEKGVQKIIKAVKLSSQEGYVRIFVDLGKEAHELLLLAREGDMDKMDRQFVTRLVEGFNKNGSPKAAAKSEVLSSREIEILIHIQNGLTNQEIAEKLFVSVNTIKTHLMNIYTKLDVHNRTEAITRIRELEII